MSAIVGYIGKNKSVSFNPKYHFEGIPNKLFEFEYGAVYLFNKNIENNSFENERYMVLTDAKIYSNREIKVKKNFAETILGCWKDKKLPQISGYYLAFIFDKLSKKCFLIRDLIGDKTLYYSNEEGFSFSTVYKSLKDSFFNYDEIETDFMYYLINVKKNRNGFTLFKTIKNFEPGFQYEINNLGDVLRKFRFDNIVLNPSADDETQIIDKFHDLLNYILLERLKDVKKIGIALSSGIDSVGLAFALRNLFPKKEIHTFTTGYGSTDPEIKVAKTVAAKINSFHHEIFTDENCITMSNMMQLSYLLEDPVGRTETLQFLLLSKEARKFVDNLILGVGGDGQFAGMNRHYFLFLIKKYPLFKNIYKQILDLAYYGKPPNSRIIEFFIKILNMEVPPEFKNNEYREPEFTIDEIKDNFINNYLLKGFMEGTDQTFVKYQKILTKFGIDFITPYHDKEFIKFSFSISDDLKIKNKIQKYILRKAYERIVPKEFTNIKKHPQKMNIDNSLFTKLCDITRTEIIDNKSSLIKNLINIDDLQTIINSKYRKEFLDMAAMKLWTVILLEYWLRIFKSDVKQQKKVVNYY